MSDYWNTNDNTSNRTTINKEINIDPYKTSINFDVHNQDPNVTSVNDEVHSDNYISLGTILCDKYEVRARMSNIISGEADLYLCEYKEKYYVAKVYRRKAAIKDSIIDKLTRIVSSHVAQLYATGYIGNHSVTITPYYKNGSLQNKKFSYEDLKKHIIPSINEGLHSLHINGIIHRDIKPSNIMLNDNGTEVSIIDFGISSVTEFNNSVVITSTGNSYDYAAPEAINNAILDLSDYYSLGITLYELFTGHLPYANLSGEERATMSALHTINFPKDMPEDLIKLIKALTYLDISNRNDKTNPNCRWGYEEVKKWCNNEYVPAPGGNPSFAYSRLPYKFGGREYNTDHELILAISSSWEEGKKDLYRGILSEYYKKIDTDLARICMDAVDEYRSSSRDIGNIVFFKILYKIDKNLDSFIWMGNRYESLDRFGEAMLDLLWKNESDADKQFRELFDNKGLSYFCNAVKTDNISVLRIVEGLENGYMQNNVDIRDRLYSYYRAAYILTGKGVFNYNGTKYYSLDQFLRYIDDADSNDEKQLLEICNELLPEYGKLDPQFACWLSYLGKNDVINSWLKNL